MISFFLRDINLPKMDFEEHGVALTGCPRCTWNLHLRVAPPRCTWNLKYGPSVSTARSHRTACRRRMRDAIRAPGPAGRRGVEAMESKRDRVRSRIATETPDIELDQLDSGEAGKDDEPSREPYREP